MTLIERLSNKNDKITEEYKNEGTEAYQGEGTKTKIVGEKDFGSGYFILNVDKKDLYEFLKANMPAGYVHETFEEFEENLKVNHFQDEDLDEIGLSYTRDEDFVIILEDDFIYTPSITSYNYFASVQKEKELLRAYERFLASKFPQEYKRNLIKRIAECKRHYMRYYGDECKRAYKIYKDNMDALNEQYRGIFDEDCPVFRK